MKNFIVATIAIFLAILCVTLPAYAGLVGGPQTKIDVFSPMTKTNYNLVLKGEEVASIIVRGNQSSDLDCFLYDKNNELITKDTDRTDVCVMRILPGVTGDFKLVIVNLGDVANTATLDFN